MGALETNQQQRAQELTSILARLGPSFAKVWPRRCVLAALPQLIG